MQYVALVGFDEWQAMSHNGTMEKNWRPQQIAAKAA